MSLTQNTTSTAKGLVSCSDIYFETDFRWFQTFFNSQQLTMLQKHFSSYLKFVFTFPKVTMFLIIFIFVLTEIFTWQTDSNSDLLQVTVQVLKCTQIDFTD